jgi:hypothetical protein
MLEQLIVSEADTCSSVVNLHAPWRRQGDPLKTSNNHPVLKRPHPRVWYLAVRTTRRALILNYFNLLNFF